MDPIQEAIEVIESHELGDEISYREVAKRVGVDRSTLSRRHQRKTRSNAEESRQRQLLNPQQELELVRYIEKCTRRGLLLMREMVADFAGAVAKWEVSESWVTRFLNRHADQLTTRWSAGIDRERHETDSGERYEA
jgi:transposase